jgi:iron complex outermembrane receptor protein
VLRGPQGTLFGRNTIGGAINITTKKPGTELGGTASVTGGSDHLLQFKATLDAPITDRILTKLTVFSRNRDGYVTRTSDGVDLGNDNKFAIRGDVRLLPTDTLTIDASIERMRDREHGAPLQLIAAYADAPFAQYNLALNGAVCATTPTAARAMARNGSRRPARITAPAASFPTSTCWA